MRRRELLVNGQKFDPNGYDYVDLGLTSGTLWATKNVGASSETDSGLFFQWGDTVGYTISQVGSGAGQKYFGEEDYIFYGGSTTSFTKYNSSDKLITLELEDDAAHVHMGGTWHMPTYEDVVSLVNQCNWTWDYTYHGYRVRNKKDSSKSIFLPSPGYCYHGNFSSSNYTSSYWTNRAYGTGSTLVYVLRTYNNGKSATYTSRQGGHLIRGVINPV